MFAVIFPKGENWWEQMFADGRSAESQDEFSKKRPQTI